MNRMRITSAACLIVFTLVAGRSAVARADTAPARIDSGGGAVLVTPILWALGALGVPTEDRAPLPNSERLERGQGWRVVEFPVRDAGLGVYLEVRGRIEFESAEVRMADGSRRPLALAHTTRGRGLYLLADFGRMDAVDLVLLRARARSGEAQVGVRLGR
jgi:hypothetical protein